MQMSALDITPSSFRFKRPITVFAHVLNGWPHEAVYGSCGLFESKQVCIHACIDTHKNKIDTGHTARMHGIRAIYIFNLFSVRLDINAKFAASTLWCMASATWPLAFWFIASALQTVTLTSTSWFLSLSLLHLASPTSLIIQFIMYQDTYHMRLLRTFTAHCNPLLQ